jgi:hypothetical protein
MTRSRITRALLMVATLAAISATAFAWTPPAAPEGVPPALNAEGWEISGGARRGYSVEADPTVTRDGHATLRLAPLAETAGYATFMRLIDAAPFQGRRVRITAFTRTRGATRRVDFWARTMGLTAPRDPALKSSDGVSLGADDDWQRHELLIDVQAGALQLQYGVGLDGPGTLWLDEPTIAIVEPEVAAPSPPAVGQQRP